MLLRWIGAVTLMALFGTFVIVPAGFVCGFSMHLLATYLVGCVTCHLLFTAAYRHECPRALTLQDVSDTQRQDDHGIRQQNVQKSDGSVAAMAAVISWLVYATMLFLLPWTGGWWLLAGLFFAISIVIVLDIIGPVLHRA